ncbi:LA2681 family HEPN domain-containing protein [Gluconobacter japonicus]|uniref:LA2681-like HEPN domain-containing protein n=1 Tax=Gluconobacter japonicus TaxID=376620 RepID=A0A9Q2IXJ5_GLUJA|nr:LA2681 family HEPN domain-containing protein [Gluconobacter japonicus]MBF0871907.1 hypothetical protein [Gluconobacter japonicus]
MSDDEALKHIGQLIDDSCDGTFERGLTRAFYLLDDLTQRPLAEENAVLAEYFRANAWAARSQIANMRPSWSWENIELQEEMLALSRAVNHPGFIKLDKIRRCQILTNRANLLSRVGRSIDAIAGWDDALCICPHFAITLGNRGAGLRHYAGMVEDNRERAILSLHAYDSLCKAMARDAVYESPNFTPLVAQFRNLANELERKLDVDAVRSMQHLDQGEHGRSKTERAYRQWCLDKRLFLCPLNDLGSYLAAATDDFMLPGITERFDERPGDYSPPPIIGFFSQMKQEYASARYMLFEGVSSTRTHFSDRGVTLTNTLDYPLYSLASERVRTAFRVAYSLLDKIAFLIDRYWKLGKVSKHINFKNVWMVEKKQRLLPQFEESNNWPLRGLYWLSKELFDDQLKQTTAADAHELHAIRNALEHTYLRVSMGWAKPFMIGQANTSGFGITIGSDELESKAIRLMQIARSALFYVSFAIDHEEREKRRANPNTMIGSMPLYDLEDRRKRRDPN